MKGKRSYRITTRYKEILDVVVSAKKSGKNFIWKKNRRALVPIYISKISPDENLIEIVYEDAGFPKTEVGEEIFLRLEQRDSAFKTLIHQAYPSGLVLRFPDEIAISENRSEPRIYFHPTDQKIAQFKKVKTHVSSSVDRNYTAIVADVSRSGLALILTPQQSLGFNVRDQIQLSELSNYRVHPPIPGEIVFKISHETKGILGSVEKGAKIGIHLKDKIPAATFDRFSAKESIVTVTDEQIVRDTAFRKNIHDQMEVVMKKMISRRNFLNLFDKLNSKKGDHQYIRHHVELLCEIMCGLGTTLGWVSQHTLDKLIYVAYLHDARYFSVPKLAKIKSKKEFDKIFSTLTEDERNVFLEGPVYAAELARQDSESYPDSIKILIQQKELPDGSGFPYGITSSQFTPLSSLFILSHYFVDYIIDHPDWTLDDFIKTHQKTLKGPYFQKIFQAMKPGSSGS